MPRLTQTLSLLAGKTAACNPPAREAANGSRLSLPSPEAFRESYARPKPGQAVQAGLLAAIAQERVLFQYEKRATLATQMLHGEGCALM